MCILGLTGLVLWWPKRGQWKYAFKVRAAAKGSALPPRAACRHRHLDFLRLHGGQLLGRGDRLAADHRHESAGLQSVRQMPTVEVQDTKRLGATEAVIAAQTAVPGAGAADHHHSGAARPAHLPSAISAMKR